MRFTTLGFAALALTATLPAQTSSHGNWVLTLGKRTFLVLSLQPSSDSTRQQCSGSVASPEHMQTKDFTSFSQVSGQTRVEPIVACAAKDGGLLLTVQNPVNPADRDSFLFYVQDANNAEMAYAEAPTLPMHLTRGTADAKVSTDWDVSRTYTPDDDAPSNSEMKRIFDEDQRIRQAWPKIDWNAADKADAERRAQTRKLLQQGELHSGEDFWWASHVFQHGTDPEDYLLAHTLSIIAVQKGYSAAIWLAAATLDRYLQSIKQPQIYGTQFFTPGNQPATQEPYNRTLISDSLRRTMDVPTLAEQDAQRRKYDTDRKLPTTEPSK